MVYPKNGLKRAYFSRKEFHFNSTFGASANALPGLPPTLGRKPFSIKDQGTSSFCTAFAGTAASEYQEGIELSPEYQVAVESRMVGYPIFNGVDPDTALQSLTKFGSLPASLSPINFERDGEAATANTNNYPLSLDIEAAKHKKKAYYHVTTGPGLDIFDAIRLALWQGRAQNSVVLAYGFWYSEWNRPGTELIHEPDGTFTIKSNGKPGVVETPSSKPGFRHNYLFIDWKEINGETYLVAQLSQAKSFGDGGLVYMSREAVNYAFKNLYFNGLRLALLVDDDGTTPVPVGYDPFAWLASFFGAIFHAFA